MQPPPPFDFSRQLVLITGKGGVGKTLVAAAMGQVAADRGKRTLVVESATRDQLAPLFGIRETGHAEARVKDRLSVINLNPPDNFREYVVKYLGQKRLYDTVFSNKVVDSFINTVPGLAELMMLGRLFYTCELSSSPRPDMVVLDGFASGHFLSLMTTPDAVLQSNLGGPLTRETERVKEFLATESRVGIIYVATPEELVVSEALEFLVKLRDKAPAKLIGVVLNRRYGWDTPTPAGGAAAVYAKHRADQVAKADQELERGMAKLKAEGLNLPVWRLAELGFVDEPLPPGFARQFLGELA